MTPARKPEPVPICPEPEPEPEPTDDVQADASHHQPRADDVELDLTCGPVPK